ncbi:MAG: hypothetical protein RMJ55_12740, partial [Roseiflexaceae bacterium]|nr:hypothetical protein [Roseiflexaceae bacterium]
EPDPLVMPDAIDALANWSESVTLFARLAPETVVLPVAVGGTISAAALRNPIPRLYRQRRDREWAAATLQVLIPAYRPPVVRVVFAEPFQAASLAELGDPPDVMRAITRRVADAMRLMQVPDQQPSTGQTLRGQPQGLPSTDGTTDMMTPAGAGVGAGLRPAPTPAPAAIKEESCNPTDSRAQSSGFTAIA